MPKRNGNGSMYFRLSIGQRIRDQIRRHHIDPFIINKTIRLAVKEAGIHKHITTHTFRHSFATHLLQAQKIIFALR